MQLILCLLVAVCRFLEELKRLDVLLFLLYLEMGKLQIDVHVTEYGTLFLWIIIQSAFRTIKKPAKLTV